MQTQFNGGQEMPPALFRLIYRSEMTIEGGPQAVADAIYEILAWSREWNRREGISGALLFDLRGFVQVLEGPPNAVKSLFGHIACDKRHRNVMLLDYVLVSSREFPSWSMAFVEPQSGSEPMFGLEPTLSGTSEAESILRLMQTLLLAQSSLDRPMQN